MSAVEGPCLIAIRAHYAGGRGPAALNLKLSGREHAGSGMVTSRMTASCHLSLN